MKQPTFSWDEATGSAMCVIQDRNKFYYGLAFCSPEDEDMKNEKTGCYIAEKRAQVSALKGRCKEMKEELKALKKYYYTINTSKYFNPNSYEVRRLMSHMGLLEADIQSLQEVIELNNKTLEHYLSEKEKFYKKIRYYRKKAENK